MSSPPHRDVRMRGFASRHTVDAAWAWLDRMARPLPCELVPLAQATGRVLFEPLVAEINVPSFDRAAMDGYALRADETIGSNNHSPVEFRVIGESYAGRPCDETVTAGTCVRIMTGAPVPTGADAVIPVESTRESLIGIEVTEVIPQGKHVGRIGEDISMGQFVLPAGRRLRPQDIAVAASLGHADLGVHRRPHVRIILTGNELVQPGMPCGPYQIYDSNSFQLRGLISRDGGVVESILHLTDAPAAIRAALQVPGADVILISGGSSVGAEDHAPQVVAESGELPIHGIAMRPSSPAGLGRIGEALVVLLPGNPVSCLCAYDFFAGRMIRQMGGRSIDWPYRSSTERLASKLVSATGRVDYCRVRRTPEGIEPVALSGASILSSTTRADGFVIVPEVTEGYASGSELTVYWYD